MISYDYLVICTGSTQQQPIHGPDSLKERSDLAKYLNNNESIQKQLKVDVIGAGIVGVEVAANIKHFNPNMDVTLVSKFDGVLKGFPPTLQTRVQTILEARNVTLTNK